MRRLLITAVLALLTGLAVSAAPASAAQTFTNETAIDIPSAGSASPSPSSIQVFGMVGQIADVTVRLNGVTHEHITDLDILLVAPDGETSIVLSNACYVSSGSSVSNTTLIVSAAAPAPAPKTGRCDMTYYRPTDYGVPGGDNWPGAPSSPHYADFHRFIGGYPNGAWSLYVYDDKFQEDGEIARGWSLIIETVVPDVTVPADPLTFGGLANPYPATRTIGGMDGIITDLDVSLSGVYHRQPEDLDILLVGPHGQRAMLMSDACHHTPVAGVNWAWDAESVELMRHDTTCPSGTYNTSTYERGDVIPGVEPDPGGGYGSNLRDFYFTEPNGDWRMYVYDDAPFQRSGFLRQRFALHMQTRPRAEVEVATASVVEGRAGELVLTRPLSGRLGPGTVSVTSTPRTAHAGDFAPATSTVDFAENEQRKTVPIRALLDDEVEGPETFAVTIAAKSGDVAPGARSTALVTIEDVPPAPKPTPEPAAASAQPSVAGPGPRSLVGPVPADRTAPQIGNVRLRGRTLTFTLSEPAAVTVRVERRAGRRWRPARGATVTARGRAGRNRLVLSDKRGRRRITIAARDAAGNRASKRVATGGRAGA